MRSRRARLVALSLAACLLLGDDCDGDIDRNALRERLAREAAAEAMGGVSLSPDSCLLLSSAMPKGLSLVPLADERLLVANGTPPSVIPIDLSTQPPTLAAPPVTALPISGVILEGVVGLGPNLALAPDSGNEQVLFIDAATGALVDGMVGVATQSELSTAVDVTFPTGAVDSAEVAVPPPPSTTSSTSGVAVSQGLLFVTTANVASGALTSNPIHLPGTVLVYDFDMTTGTPVISGNPPLVIFTTGYNPTNVTPYTRSSGRNFVLVTTTGPVGLDGSRIDFATSSTAATRIGYIEVIEIFAVGDPALVALIPLGERAPGFGKLAIYPSSGRVGAIGSLVGTTGGLPSPKERRVLAVDLETLDSLPAVAPATPVRLDGSGGNPDAVIADPSLEIEAIMGGPPGVSCSGSVTATAWTPGGRLLAAELCDGTITSWNVNVGVTPPAFALRKETAVVAPFSLFSSDLQAPSDMQVRNGSASSGADVFLLLSLPGGSLCGLASGAL